MQTLHTITQTDMPKPVLFAAADTFFFMCDIFSIVVNVFVLS